MPSYSLFPDNFTVYRKDRDQHGGGVFVATKDKLISVDMPNLDSVAKSSGLVYSLQVLNISI